MFGGDIPTSRWASDRESEQSVVASACRLATVDISAGAVVVAIVIGGALLGVTGALLAVPVAAAVQLIVREVVMPMQERS